jgi:hypothetical protein
LRELEEAQAANDEAVKAAEASAELAQGRASAMELELEEALVQARNAERETAEIRMAYEDALAAREELATQLQQLQKQLDAEREKNRLNEEQLEEERARGTKSVLASQLSEALKEAEDARAEVRELKRKLEQAQRLVAQAGDGAATATAPRHSVEEELNLVRRAAEAKGGGKFTIGELLVNAGLVTPAQVDEAIEIQRNDRQQHIGAILVANGWASEEAVAQALAYQCNVPFVRMDTLSLKPESAGLISERLAHQHSCIPIDSDGATMTLAMVNPLDLVAIEDIERATSLKVEVVVGVPREIKEAIEKYYWEPA